MCSSELDGEGVALKKDIQKRHGRYLKRKADDKAAPFMPRKMHRRKVKQVLSMIDNQVRALACLPSSVFRACCSLLVGGPPKLTVDQYLVEGGRYTPKGRVQ